MVLKKSKSNLNSGLTQRGITHRRLTRVWALGSRPICSYDEHDQLSVKVHIRDRNDTVVAKVASGLREIQDYLECDGLADMFSVAYHIPSHRTPNRTPLIQYSLDKRKRWLLPQRIQHMMADTEFLSDLASSVSLKVEGIQNMSGVDHWRRAKKKTISSREVLKESSGEVTEKQEEKKSRTRHTYHGRGVQRPHLFNKGSKQTTQATTAEQVVHEDEQVGEVDMTVYGPYQIDARCASYRHLPKKYRDYTLYRGKSSIKMKSCVNGKKSQRRGYTYPGIREEKNMYFCDTVENDQDVEGVNDENEPCDDYIQVRQPSTFDIADFITQPQTRLKGKRKKVLKETEGNGDGEDLVKYPKGSFIVLPKEECSLIQSMGSWHFVDETDLDESHTTESESGYNSRHSESDSDANISHREPKPDPENTDHMELQFEDVVAFDNSFMEVKLQMTDEEASWFRIVNNKTERKIQNAVDEHTIFIGTSVPHCFMVHFGNVKQQEELDMYLVGRQTSSPDLWFISLQSKTCLPDDHTLRDLESLVASCEKDGTSIGFTDLIKAVKLFHSTIQKDQHYDFKVKDVAECLTQQSKLKVEPVNKMSVSHQNVWHSMPCGVNPGTATTVTEAFHLLQTKAHTENRSNIVSDSLCAVDICEENHDECGICFMAYDSSEMATSAVMLSPCKHVYCVSCWRSHMHHSIRNGAVKMMCMETKCSCEMDKTTAMTLFPFEIINKWQTRVQDRCIDTNLYSNWCPNEVCDKVVVSSSSPLKCQFGTAVVCQCGHCWCGSCQKTPHWPASCDQMAACRTLLAKFGFSRRGFDFHNTNFYIRLKRCPKCDYPIEKNEGCPSMVCRMCWYNFCWNCLRDGGSHNLYSCKERSDNFVTYNLQNQLDIPLKYFPQLMDTLKKIEKINKMGCWLERLERTQPGTVRLPTKVLCKYDSATALEKALALAREAASFVGQAYTLQETWYILLCFAQIKKSKVTKPIVGKALAKVTQLDFIMWRLEENIICKSLPQICKSLDSGRGLLQAGAFVLSELTVLAPKVQDVSKDVETAWVGQLDPSKTIRYR